VTIKEGHRVSDLSIEVPTPNDLFAVAMVPSAAGGATLRMTPDVVDRTSVRLKNGRDVQQAYLLTYRYLPSGIVKKERFYAIIHHPSLRPFHLIDATTARIIRINPRKRMMYM